MSEVQVSYLGDQTCAALDNKSGRQISSDCSVAKGNEFGPESLVAAGLGTCMLIMMSSYAERHDLDVVGAKADVQAALGGKAPMRITKFNVTIRVPNTFTDEEKQRLEKAAEACPIRHSFGPHTEFTTRFEFGDTSVAAA